MSVTTVSYMIDLALLILFAFSAVRAWQTGFAAALARLAGTVLGIAGAAWGSQTLAPIVYNQYISAALAERVEEALAQNGGDLTAALDQLTFLPASLRETLAQTVQAGTQALPQQVIASLEPVLLPMIELVIVVVLWLVISALIRLVVSLLRGVNGVPFLGGVNRFFGLLLGLVSGAVNCWLVVMVLWFVMTIAAGRVDFLAPGVLNRSVGYSFFSAFNPFLTHY